jgi:xanthine dehydrogenase YagR molybdenum-binding subunit
MTHPVRTTEAVTGQPFARVDGWLKVTGAARYAADNPVGNLLYGLLVCSTVARGGVERVDSSAALGHRGVLRVLTGFRGVALPFDPGQVALLRAARRGGGGVHAGGGRARGSSGDGALFDRTAVD